MNIDQQLASLFTSLDDVLDLERGLADATLPRAHAELVAGLDDTLDVEAGLARVVPPPPRSVPVPTAFATLAHELSALPAADRLVARVWLPVELLVEAQLVATQAAAIRVLLETLYRTRTLPEVDASVRVQMRRIVDALKHDEVKPVELRNIARKVSRTLRRGTPQTAEWVRRYSYELGSLTAERLSNLLFEINHRAYGRTEARFFEGAASYAADLLEPLDRMLSALTSMAGADLASADLNGLPLDGVRWSSATRWPESWQEWVRGNSVAVSADLFEIRADTRGSRVTT